MTKYVIKYEYSHLLGRNIYRVYRRWNPFGFLDEYVVCGGDTLEEAEKSAKKYHENEKKQGDVKVIEL